MDTAITDASKSLELLVSQNEKIINIKNNSKQIENTLSYSKYIIETFNGFIKRAFKPNISKTTHSHTTIDIGSIVSINEQINKILDEQNKTLSEITQYTINNNKKIKSITSHHPF
jgi:hypothetical protein